MAAELNNNPDVEELLRYNRHGCRHPGVPGALTRDQAEAARSKLDFIQVMQAYGSRWCTACCSDVMVPREVPIMRNQPA